VCYLARKADTLPSSPSPHLHLEAWVAVPPSLQPESNHKYSEMARHLARLLCAGAWRSIVEGYAGSFSDFHKGKFFPQFVADPKRSVAALPPNGPRVILPVEWTVAMVGEHIKREPTECACVTRAHMAMSAPWALSLIWSIRFHQHETEGPVRTGVRAALCLVLPRAHNPPPPSIVTGSPRSYVRRGSPRVLRWMREMRARHGVRFFIVTNSVPQYAALCLDTAYGKVARSSW